MERVTKVQKHKIKKMLRENKKFRAERVMNHDPKSNFEAPPGYQIEDPVRLQLEDGLERVRYFFGNLSQAVTEDQRGDEKFEEIVRWLDPKHGDYKVMAQALVEDGFQLDPTDMSCREFVKVTTLQEAYTSRLEAQGRVSGLTPQVGLDDDPNTYWKWEYARRAKGEMNLPTPWAREGSRDRKDRSYHDPEDVPWGDMTESDPFGQGVQTVDVENELTGKTETMWLQVKKLYGPIVGPDGDIAEGLVGTEQTPQPFWKLVIPASIQWWEVYGSDKRPMKGIKASKLEGIWNYFDQFRQQIDDADCEIRGFDTLPWGVTTIRVMIPIPEELKAANPMLEMIEAFKDASYFVFDVMGPAVPALKEEFLKRCAAASQPRPIGSRNRHDAKALCLARKTMEKDRKALAKVQCETASPKVKEAKQTTRPEYTKVKCRFCGRPVGYVRELAIKELMRECETVQGCQKLQDALTRCIYTKEHRDANGTYTTRKYCTGDDVAASSNTDVVG